MADRQYWGNVYTTVQGDGKFLAGGGNYGCTEPNCQPNTSPGGGWPPNSFQLTMRPFKRMMFDQGWTDGINYQWKIDPASRRFVTNDDIYGLDFAWYTVGMTNQNQMFAPYITTPPNYQTPNWDTLVTTGTARNLNGWKKSSLFSTGINAGLCYNPATNPDYPVTVGDVIGSPKTPIGWPGTTWPANKDTNACQWIDFNTVYRCCANVGFAEIEPKLCVPESGGYTGSNSQACQNIMLEMCENNWTQEACAAYLQSFENGAGIKDVATVFQNASVNYINKMAERTGCGTNDYTTPKLNSCIATKGPNAGQPRDDSKDTFINGTLKNFCNANPGVFDNLLNQYCGEFTRSDLDADPVLQSLCGCHLSDGSPAAPGSEPLDLANPKQTNTQYVYPDITISCDPICARAGTIPSKAKACARTVCIMDNVGINMINSQCKDVDITQVCGASFDGSGTTGDCYMSNTGINAINSNCGYAVISQYCNACYKYDPENPAAATRVPCPAGSNGGNVGPGSGGGSSLSGLGIGAWLKTHPFYTAGIIILLVLLIFIILLFTTGKKTPASNVEYINADRIPVGEEIYLNS